MIETKEDLKRYLEMDKFAYGAKRNRPKIYGDEIWKYLICLRKHEYYANVKKDFFSKIVRKYYSFKHRSLGMKLCYDIPINTLKGVGKAIPSGSHNHSSKRKDWRMVRTAARCYSWSGNITE